MLLLPTLLLPSAPRLWSSLSFGPASPVVPVQIRRGPTVSLFLLHYGPRPVRIPLLSLWRLVLFGAGLFALTGRNGSTTVVLRPPFGPLPSPWPACLHDALPGLAESFFMAVVSPFSHRSKTSCSSLISRAHTHSWASLNENLAAEER